MLNNPAGPRNNFGFQLSNLQLLSSILAGVTPPGGLATEATALNILASIQSGKEFEQNVVVDLGGVGCPTNCPAYLMVRVWNTITHTFDPPVYYDASGAVVVPVGPVELLNPQLVLNNILTQVTAINNSTTPPDYQRYRNTALSNTDVDVAVAGVSGLYVRGFNIINPNSSDVYIKFYNSTAASTTVGTTVPVLSLMVPANGSIFEPFENNKIIALFTTALSIACVTGLADASTTAPTTPIHISLQYSN